MTTAPVTGRDSACQTMALLLPGEIPRRKLTVLNDSVVAELGISLDEVIRLTQHAFERKGQGRLLSLPKFGLTPHPDSTLRAMIALLPEEGVAGTKWVAAYPTNPDAGLETISGVVLINDAPTGQLLAVIDCRWITALRTAATTAVAARQLARSDSAVAAIIACGRQGRANLTALARELPLERAMVYDIDRAAAETFAAVMGPALGIRITPVDSVEAAVSAADVTVSSLPVTRSPEPEITAEMLRPGSLTVALDFDASVTPDAMRRCDRLVTDDLEQWRALAEDEGYFDDAPEPADDLGMIAAGGVQGRRSAEERIVSVHLGVAMLDVALAAEAYRRAESKGKGRRVAF